MIQLSISLIYFHSIEGGMGREAVDHLVRNEGTLQHGCNPHTHTKFFASSSRFILLSKYHLVSFPLDSLHFKLPQAMDESANIRCRYMALRVSTVNIVTYSCSSVIKSCEFQRLLQGVARCESRSSNVIVPGTDHPPPNNLDFLGRYLA